MKNWKNILRWFFVSAGIVLLTSLTVDATLSPNSLSQSALGILATNVVPKKECGVGSVRIEVSGKSLCVDAFEESAGEQCDHSSVSSPLETRGNSDDASCVPESKAGAKPWA